MKYGLAISLFLIGNQLLCASTVVAQLIVAHRGASHDAPENTLAAFRLAWEQGADAIEGDCYLTADKRIVFIHDRNAELVSGRNIYVGKATLCELQQLDVGTWKHSQFANEKIPLSGQVAKVVPADKKIYIDLKSGPEIVPILKSHLESLELVSDQIVLISFSRDVLLAVKHHIPDCQAYWLLQFRKDSETKKWYPTIDEMIVTAQAIGVDGVDIQANAPLIDSQLVDKCRRAGLSIHAWTVDNPKLARELQELGFDSITTNRPEFLRAALRPLQNASFDRL